MLETKIEALTKAVEALTAQLADATPADAKPVTKAKTKATTTEAAEANPTDAEKAQADVMTMEEMTRAALALSRDGKGDAVRAKLKALGVTRITLLGADQLGEFQAFLYGAAQ